MSIQFPPQQKNNPLDFLNEVLQRDEDEKKQKLLEDLSKIFDADGSNLLHLVTYLQTPDAAQLLDQVTLEEIVTEITRGIQPAASRPQQRARMSKNDLEAIKEKTIKVLERATEPMSSSDIAAELLPVVLTPPQRSNLLRDLVDSGVVSKDGEKINTRYSIQKKAAAKKAS